MYYKKLKGQILFNHYYEKARDDTFEPPLTDRDNFYYWVAVLDERTCPECYRHHGKYFSRHNSPEEYHHKHPICRCERISVKGVKAGMATKNGANGADWYLKYYGRLPDYYISKEDLEKLGWRKGDRPSQFAPGKMLAGGVYNNDNGFLPDAPGRIWYEADINYTPGRRNDHRVIWSNDGLIFVTYDHYITFYEIY